MSGLDLGLELFTKGRPSVIIGCEYVRDLSEADLQAAHAMTGPRKPLGPMKRITDRHHALARALASGMPKFEAALVCGYETARITQLLEDPAFKELLNFYREEKDRAFRSVQDKLAGIASDALDEIQTRIEDEPEALSMTQLMALVQLAADRTGNGPQSTQNVNVNSGVADRLAAARERVKERRLTLVATKTDSGPGSDSGSD